MRGLPIPAGSLVLVAFWAVVSPVWAAAPCEPGFPGDFDQDGDIDGGDLDILAGCATGPEAGPLADGCEPTDLDGDGDGDSTDFGIWQTLFTGPGDCPPRILEPPNGQIPGPLRTTYLHSGEFFESAVDLHIRGRGLDFVWGRKYRARIGPNTAMGNGWDFSYNIHIERVGPHVRVFDGNARADLYRRSQVFGVWATIGFFNVLRQDREGTFTLLFPDTGKWVFNPLDGSPTAGKIAAIADRNGNALRFDYDAQGRLIKVHDTLDTPDHNRDITIAYNKDGFIESVTDFVGRRVSYEYYRDGDAGGSAGDLKSVTSPAVVGTPTFNDFPLGKTTV